MPLLIEDIDETNETLLIHETARQLRVCFDRRAQCIGLTRAQWRVLAVLRRNPGLNQKQLADRLEVEPITLTRLLDRMSKAGWIERRPNPEDRRANVLYIDARAKDIIKKMRQIAVGVRRDALADFTPAEHEALLSYLKRMKANVSNMVCTDGNHEGK